MTERKVFKQKVQNIEEKIVIWVTLDWFIAQKQNTHFVHVKCSISINTAN